ncbi:MAG: 1-acyl-sn-glycerol-3-phosphate acyltransferase, partial [Spirochaetia bacterium]|nr:1-acyl-sn-glycerol-3-phosphate acyltransferase [Spirochaetia bacterium]
GIFPEGHDFMVKNDFNGPMVSFHTGFATFAMRAKAPIVPFVITPIEEDIETIPFPPAVRSFFGLPEEVCRIPNRVNYRSVRIVFSEALPMSRFEGMKEMEMQEAIIAETRRAMLQLQIETGMLTKGAVS